MVRKKRAKSNQKMFIIILIAAAVGIAALLGILLSSKGNLKQNTADEQVKSISMAAMLKMQKLLTLLNLGEADPNTIEIMSQDIINDFKKIKDLIPYTSLSNEKKKDLLKLYDADIRYLNLTIKIYKYMLPQTEKIINGDKNVSLQSYFEVIDNLTAAYNEIADIKREISTIKHLNITVSMALFSKDLEILNAFINRLKSPKFKYGIMMGKYIDMVSSDQAIKNVAVELQKKYGYAFDDVEYGVFEYFRNFSYINAGFDVENNSVDVDDPKTVLERGAGNCLELSLLAASIFEAAGIETGLCFVDTTKDRYIWKENPTVFMPDHAIIIIYDEGKDLWYVFDPTCAVDGADLDYFNYCLESIVEKAKVCRDVETGAYIVP